MNGETINKTIIDKTYNLYKSSTYTRTYYDDKLKEGNGKIGADCSGCMYPVSGFDTTAQNYYNKCVEKNVIGLIPRNKPCLVFKGKSASAINHIGFYCGNGYVIEMKSSKANCVKAKLDGNNWKWYGIPAWINYSESANVTPSKTEKCIDVSSYQGVIDWTQVKNSGVTSVILKVIQKNLSVDSRFEQNYSSAIKAGLNILGYYNYSYALTKEKAVEDANAVLKVLNGRKGIVWLDLEDKSQQGLGKTIVDIINSYGAVVESAGYEFGLYTGMSFYSNYIKPYKSQIKCDKFWIARYFNGYNKMAVATDPNEQYNPKTTTGLDIYAWQYTSSGVVPGINGNVDINMVYGNTTSPVVITDLSTSETLITMMGKVTTSSGSLNIRSSASSSASIVGKYKKGEIIQLTAKTTNGWYKTDKGYVCDDYVSGVQGEVIDCSKLNLRSSATTEQDNKIGILSRGDKVQMLREDGDWYKIQTAKNVVGYVSKKYIAIK